MPPTYDHNKFVRLKYDRNCFYPFGLEEDIYHKCLLTSKASTIISKKMKLNFGFHNNTLNDLCFVLSLLQRIVYIIIIIFT